MNKETPKTEINVVDKQTAELEIGNEVIELEIPSPQQNSKECAINPPKFLIELEWVYGYRGHDLHKTMVFVKSTNELAYLSGKVVVLLDNDERKQRFYRQHDANVLVIAITSHHDIIATGQEEKLGKSPGPAVIHVWNAETLETLRTIGSNYEFYKAVVHVDFADEALCVVSSGDFHVLSVWNWKTGTVIANPYKSANPVFALQFNPLLPIPLEMVSFGRGKLFSWIVKRDATLQPTLIELNLLKKRKRATTLDTSEPEPSYFTCFSFSQYADIMIGDSEGYLHILKKADRSQVISTHTGHTTPVLSIQKLPTGRVVVGNCDGWVSIWDITYNTRLFSFALDPLFGGIRNATGSSDGQIYAGTNKNCIIDVNNHSQLVPFTGGHINKARELSTSPGWHFVTCGKDKRVVMWDSIQHEMEWVTELKYEASCVAMSASDTYVAVGCYTGNWVLINAKVGHPFSEGRVCYDPIECIGFSPVDTYLAMGAKSGEIYIFMVLERDLMPQGKLKMPIGPTTHLDWAVDSYHLRTCSNDRIIYYWSIPSCTRDDSDYVKYDHYWWTKTCTTAYLSAGIWRNAKDLSDVTTVFTNPSEKLLASGNKDGTISIFRYPCSSMKCEPITITAHTAKVIALTFLKSTLRLITLGENDCSILQWKLSVAPVNVAKLK